MLDWIEHAIRSMGYAGITLLMAAENLFPPIPSELIMPLAGWTAQQGGLSFAGVVLAGTAGSVLGALALYGLGAWIGEARLKAWTGRHGHWLLLRPEDLDDAAEWFRRRGVLAVLIARVIPGVRSLISIPAGLCRMPLGPFLAMTAVGTAAWTALLAWLGVLLGRNYAAVGEYLGPAASLILGALAVLYVVRVLRRRSAAKAQARRDG